MQSMPIVRERLFGQLRNMINVYKYTIQTISAEDATTLRDGGAGWTVLEVMCHMRDFEAVFIERTNLTLNQDMAALPFPDPNGLVVEKRYSDQDLMTVLGEWVDLREAYLLLVQSIMDEDWERTAMHPTRGEMTLNDQMLVTVWHDLNHLEQITHILQSPLSHNYCLRTVGP